MNCHHCSVLHGRSMHNIHELPSLLCATSQLNTQLMNCHHCSVPHASSTHHIHELPSLLCAISQLSTQHQWTAIISLCYNPAQYTTLMNCHHCSMQHASSTNHIHKLSPFLCATSQLNTTFMNCNHCSVIQVILVQNTHELPSLFCVTSTLKTQHSWTTIISTMIQASSMHDTYELQFLLLCPKPCKDKQVFFFKGWPSRADLLVTRA